MNTFEQVISFDNIYLAYKRLQTAQRNNYKDLYADDMYNFGRHLEDNIYLLIHELEDDIYEPVAANKIYIPKANGLVRSLSVLNFIDLLVYQSIINVIADIFYQDFRVYYNKFVFGNIYNKTEDENKIFFYAQWKQQWDKYKKCTKRYYDEGFKYILKFDIASFYDAIDHHLLENILRKKGVDYKTTNILLKQLKTWTSDKNRKGGNLRKGIPQGPIGSGLLSEVYIHYLDKKMRDKVYKSKDIRYIRYVDDIRLFAQSAYDAQKYLIYLDILCKDIGLIPQANKIEIEEITNIYAFLNKGLNFSLVDKRYRISKSISKKQNRKMTDKLKKTLNDEEFDKTIIRFSLYKIEKNDEIRDLLIQKSSKIIYLYDEICFYLNKYYSNCEKVKEWIHKQLKEPPIYKWVIAVLFKHFYKMIEFNKEMFDRFSEDSIYEDWYIKYFFLDWINYNESEYLNHIETDNTLVTKKKYKLQFINSDREEIRHLIIDNLVTSEDITLALEGSKLAYEDKYDISQQKGVNKFLYGMLGVAHSNYMAEKLSSYGIKDANVFFNDQIWTDDEYSNLKEKFMDAEINSEISPKNWLIHIDSFNHIMTVKLLELNGVEIKDIKEYGGLLDKGNYLKSELPYTYYTFKEIHGQRNIVGHPYDKDGKKPEKISWKYYYDLRKKEIESLKEIVGSVGVCYALEDIAVAKE